MIYSKRSIFYSRGENNKNRGVWENRGYIFYSNVKKFYMALYYKMQMVI